jgi:hypothetical protein
MPTKKEIREAEKAKRESEKAKQEQISELLKEWKETKVASKEEEQEIKDRNSRLTAKAIRQAPLRQRCNELAREVYDLTKADNGEAQPAGQGSDGTIYTAHPKDATYGLIDEVGDLVMAPMIDDEGPIVDESGEPVLEPQVETVKVYQVRTHKPPQAGRKLSL